MKSPPERQLLATLGQASDGLLFPSESDAPFTPYGFPEPAGVEPTAASLLEAEHLPSDTPVETVTLGDLFDPFVAADPGASAEDLAEAARYRELVELLSHELTHLRVYRVGKTDIDVYILGQDPRGAWLGLKTHVVET
jgi:hypothetical protein